MFATKLFLAAVLLVCVSARHIQFEDVPYGEHEEYRYPVYDVDEDFEYQHPGHLASARVRRQAQASYTLNGDGTSGVNAKIPLVGNGQNVLSALGSAGYDDKNQLASRGFGLALDNVNGHGVSVMKETLPGFGSKLTGEGHATLFHNDNHNVGANAFVSRNMPTNYPGVPNFNTVGAGVDYMFKNKVGTSLSMANTPFLERKDYSAMGNLNLFRSPTGTVDFTAGYKRFEMPRFDSGWKPNFGITFGRSF
ncbi:attacin-A-like [Anticarsia gemmatalis]|uniref:attacin-A-like n=1 Tax=Anticarsia gemmatalis TaxID=129554 RepID=UPI003F7587A1